MFVPPPHPTPRAERDKKSSQAWNSAGMMIEKVYIAGAKNVRSKTIMQNYVGPKSISKIILHGIGDQR